MKTKSIREYLYTKDLYDDVINIILDYLNLTIKEQCLDKKSLKRFAKHQNWLKKQNYNKSIDDKIRHSKEVLREYNNKLQYYTEFIFINNLTPPPMVIRQDRISIFPTKRLFIHPLSKEEVINVDFIISNLKDQVEVQQYSLKSLINSERYNFYGKLCDENNGN